MSIENPLLKDKVSSLEELNSYYTISDSLQRQEIVNYQKALEFNNQHLKKLKRAKNGIIIGSSIAVVLSFIIGLAI